MSRPALYSVCAAWKVWILVLLALVNAASFAQEGANEELEPYRLGVGFYERERYKQAIESLSKFLKDSPTNAKAENARFVLGLSQVRLDDFQAARGTFQKFIRDYPQAKRNSEARYWVGHCSFHLRDYQSAETELGEFTNKYSTSPLMEHALPYLADSQLKRGQFAKALSTFETAIQKFPSGAMIADSEYGRARAQEGLKQFDQAERSYRDIADQKGHEFAADARFQLASLLFEQRKYKPAAREFEAYAEKNPQGTQLGAAYLNQGFALFEAGEFQASELSFKRAAEVASIAAEATLWFGLALKKQAKFEQAARWFENGFTRFGKTAQAEPMLYHWGDALVRSAQGKLALEKFDLLLATYPSGKLREEAIVGAMQGAIADKLWDQSTEINKRYRAEFPQGRLRLRMAILLARVDLLRGIELQSRGKTQDARVRFQEAARAFEEVAKGTQIASTRLQARFYLGEALLKLEQFDQAISATNLVSEDAQRPESNSEFIDVFVQRAVAYLEGARQLSRQGTKSQSPNPPTSEIIQRCESAVTETNSYEAKAPRGALLAQCWYVRAVAAALSGSKQSTNSALQTLKKSYARQPEREIALLEVGEISYARADYAFAAQLYQELSEVSTHIERKPRALADLGWCRVQQEEHAQAAAAFGQLVREFPEHALVPEAALMVGQSLAALGKKTEAQKAYASAFALPVDSDHTFQAGWRGARMLFDSGDLKGADAGFEAVLKRFANHPRADRVLDDWATRYYDTEDFARSDALFKRLIETYPRSPLVWNARVIIAESKLLSGKLKEAEVDFTSITESKDADSRVREQALFQLQNVARETMDWRRLATLADQSLQLFPLGDFLLEAEFSRAEADLMLEKFPQAIERFQKLRAKKQDAEVANKPWFGKVFARLAESLVRTMDYKQAEAVIADLETTFPTSPWLYLALDMRGRALKNQARFAEARAAYQKVIDDRYGRKTETAARAQLMLADTYILEKNYEAALDEYLKVEIGYDFKYWQAAALYHAGTCQESLNDRAAARKTYARLLANYPESEFVAKAKQRLAAVSKADSAASP